VQTGIGPVRGSGFVRRRAELVQQHAQSDSECGEDEQRSSERYDWALHQQGRQRTLCVPSKEDVHDHRPVPGSNEGAPVSIPVDRLLSMRPQSPSSHGPHSTPVAPSIALATETRVDEQSPAIDVDDFVTETLIE